MKMKLTLIAMLCVACLTGATRAQSTQPVSAAAMSRPIRVALYSDTGSEKAYEKFEKILKTDPHRYVTKLVSAEDIRNGALKDCDVLIQGGGSGSKCAQTLGVDGREQIKSFVNKGGGYLGVCAGAYLATSSYPWSLGILNAKVMDRKHWARGKGQVLIQVDEVGQNLLGFSGEHVDIRYAQGPLLAPDNKPDLPAYTELAKFETEIAENGAPPGVMIGKTAMAMSTYGKGRVICSSPHPEQTKGLEIIIRNAVNLLGAPTPAVSAEPPAK